MAYNPYSAINAIYKLKGQWDSANSIGNTQEKNNVAKKAQAYYNQLRQNGYSDIADQLTASNYQQAKSINDTWAKKGKTATRDYFYSLGKSRGMSTSDIDKLIGWDNDTKEVSFGGKKIGTPDALVDGVSYWNSTDVLDNAFNDYIKRSGNTISDDTLYKQTMQTNINKNNEQWNQMQQNAKEILSKYSQEYDDLKKTNPFTTDVAKSILSKYDLAGLQSRDNEVATNAGSNGGNIDSFASANALRQQSALVNQGQQVVLDQYQQRLDHARALLSDMGVRMSRDYGDQDTNIKTGSGLAQQLFDNSETAKNNEVARESEVSSVSGYTTDNQLKATSSLWKADGSLANVNMDYQAEINKVKALYDNATSSIDKQNYALQLKLLEMARNDKIVQTGSSEKPTYLYQNLVNNYQKYSTDKQIESAERISNASNNAEMNKVNAQLQSNENINNAQLQSNEKIAGMELEGKKPTLTASQVVTALKNGEKSQSVIDAYNYYYGTSYTVDNPPKLGGLNESNNNQGGENSSEVTVVTFDEPYDANKAAGVGVDKHGKSMYDALSTHANINGGFLKEDEIIEFMVKNSDAYNTNLNQLKKLAKYLGVNEAKLEDYQDKGYWFWQWGEGVEEKK